MKNYLHLCVLQKLLEMLMKFLSRKIYKIWIKMSTMYFKGQNKHADLRSNFNSNIVVPAHSALALGKKCNNILIC